MEIRVRSTGAVMHETEFRRWLRDTNGPSYDVLTTEVMGLLGVDPIFEGPQASGGTVYQHSERSGVEQINGNWYTKYVLGPTFATAEEELLYKQEMDAAQWARIRADRNQRLLACDWTQLADSPVDPFPWITYREALRDITLQSDPFNIVWPSPPAA